MPTSTNSNSNSGNRRLPRYSREPAMRIVIRFVVMAIVLSLGLFAGAAAAQQQPIETEGVNSGNYNVKQSFEVGYRFFDLGDNSSLRSYSTFVNLFDGPRFLEHSLDMRSLDHMGFFWDNFSLSSYGYGGDPNSFTRLRAYKNKWYNFSANFRRNRNMWDYNLLANPLNPPSSNPFVPIDYSLHRFETTRRMTDYNLTLMPQSRVRLRLGYSRNINEGPSLTTFHEGTDIQLFQNWKTTVNAYQIGADFKFIPRTNISYDQFFNYFKNDTSLTDNNFGFQLSNGTPVDLGIIFNTAATQPCATPVTSFATNPPTANATCNAYIQYDRVGLPRAMFPTEQLAFQSNYWRKVDLSGRFSYSSADNEIFDYNEFARGLVSRTRQVQFSLADAPTDVRRIAVTADFGVTFFINDKFRISDSFHFQNFRIPGFSAFTECSYFSTSMLIAPNVFTPTTPTPGNCPAAVGGVAGTPNHASSSPADIIRESTNSFFQEDTKTNLVEVAYDFTKRIGARIGYRFRDRFFHHWEVESADLHFFPSLPNRGACAGQPLLADGSCRTSTSGALDEVFNSNEHSLLTGFWARPHDSLRFTFDLEWMYADAAFTRISPRHRQNYKLRGTWKPRDWMNFSGNVNILESRNNVVEIAHRQHVRSYGIAADIRPNDRWGFDIGYDFNDVMSLTNICFTGTVRPPGSSPCPGAITIFQQVSLYNHDTHYGHIFVFISPVQRVRLNLGYSGVSTDGQTLFLILTPPEGTLRYAYHRPSAEVAIDLVRGVTFKTGWNLYNFNEKAPQDPFTAPRDFRSNLVTLSLRYAF